MKDTIYLVLSRTKVERMVKSSPRLKANEIFVSLKITVPDELFNRPTFGGELTIEDDGSGFELEIKQIEHEIQGLRNR